MKQCSICLMMPRYLVTALGVVEIDEFHELYYSTSELVFDSRNKAIEFLCFKVLEEIQKAA